MVGFVFRLSGGFGPEKGKGVDCLDLGNELIVCEGLCLG